MDAPSLQCCILGLLSGEPRFEQPAELGFGRDVRGFKLADPCEEVLFLLFAA
jgi:hypothetical protein